jgi:multicomponent Na+:H+ antiporter subunit B
MTSRALIAEVFIRALYAVLLLASVWILLRGHNAPGGGFIGGLLAVAASAAYALVLGSRQALRRLPFEPLPLAVCGVLLALLSGLPAVLTERPFLTHLWFSLPLGVIEIPLSTVLLFDLGVYLCVWGAIGGYCLALVGEIEKDT